MKILILGLGLVEAHRQCCFRSATITGAGASFPYPLYSKMFAEYKTATGNDVNYQSVGSGAGQQQIHRPHGGLRGQR